MTKTLLFRKESFADVMAELPPLLHWHHREIEPEDGIPLDFNFPAYVGLEQAGMCSLVTARCGGKLVGYALSIIGKHLHSRAVTYGHTNFYLYPEYRIGWNGIKLLKAVDESLRELGVHDSHIGDHPGHELASIYRRMGYTLSERSYTKILGR